MQRTRLILSRQDTGFLTEATVFFLMKLSSQDKNSFPFPSFIIPLFTRTSMRIYFGNEFGHPYICGNDQGLTLCFPNQNDSIDLQWYPYTVQLRSKTVHQEAQLFRFNISHATPKVAYLLLLKNYSVGMYQTE